MVSQKAVIVMLVIALLLSALAVVMVMSIDFKSTINNLRFSSSRSQAEAEVSIRVEPNEYSQGVANG